MKNVSNSKFIVFEGLDGSGKTTQMHKLSEKLKEKGIPHITTHEPSDNDIGRLAREAVQKKIELEPETLLLLFAADRYEHTKNEIIPALQSGKHVLCDRYYYSNIAYQGLKFGYDRIIALNEDTLNIIKPDLTLFLDAPPGECMKRRSIASTEKELFDDINMQTIIRDCYFRAFSLLNGENVEALDATPDEDTVLSVVWNIVSELLE